MYDLSAISLSDMTRFGASLRTCGHGASSMEAVSQKIVDRLYQDFTIQDTATPACALVRVFRTMKFEAQGPDLQAFGSSLTAGHELEPSTRCLTLLATAGDEAAWNDRLKSNGHQSIPLPSEGVVDAIPMISQLIAQLGVDVASVVRPDPALAMEEGEQAYNVFFIEEAAGSPFIPAQEFVAAHGIRSVLGFGGRLPSADVFAVLMFCKTPVSKTAADLFRNAALNVKVALLPFDDGPIFSRTSKTTVPTTDPREKENRRLRSQVAVLNELLAVQERTVLEQSSRLEALVRDGRANEERLVSTFEAVLDAIILIDDRGTILTVNRACVKLFGYSAEELGGQNVRILMPDRESAEHDGYLRAYRETKVAKVIGIGREVVGRRKDGSTFPAHLSVTEVLATEGLSFVGVVRDISKRKLAERLSDRQRVAAELLHEVSDFSLHASGIEAALAHCVEEVCVRMGWPVGHVYARPQGGSHLLPAGIWYVENEERASRFRAITERTSFSLGEGLPGRIWESQSPAWIPDVHLDPNFPRAAQAKELGVRGAFGLPVIIGDQVTFVLEFFTWKSIEQDPHLLMTARSLSNSLSHVLDRRRSRVELEEAWVSAKEANEAKSRFLANMSHELRTPLNSIIGFTNILHKNRRGQLNNKELGYLSRVSSNGKHLLALINEVLDLAKIEAGQMVLNLTDTQPAVIAEEVLQGLSGGASREGIELRILVSEEVQSTRADPLRVKQVLINLVGNAIKFSKPGGQVLVELVANRTTRTLERIDVIDEGIGVTPGKQELIFQEFRQADDTTSRDYGGTGLGLRLARAMCEAMGFSLTLSSELGRGSIFSIHFVEPVGLVQLRPPAGGRPVRESVPAAPPELPNSPELAGPDSRAWSKERTILLIDDESDARELLESTLLGLGHKVFMASSGETGIEMAAALRPDLITLDMMMPGMDGWAVLRNISADPRTASIPVAIVSVIAGEVKATMAGPIAFLEKPVSSAALASLLSRKELVAPNLLLLVDDDADTRAYLRELVAELSEVYPMTLRTASNGLEAMSAYRDQRPDAILLDLMMPEMDGFAFLDQLRVEIEDLETPVIVVSGRELTHEDRQRLGSASAILAKGESLANSLRDSLLRILLTSARPS